MRVHIDLLVGADDSLVIAVSSGGKRAEIELPANPDDHDAVVKRDVREAVADLARQLYPDYSVLGINDEVEKALTSQKIALVVVNRMRFAEEAA